MAQVFKVMCRGECVGYGDTAQQAQEIIKMKKLPNGAKKTSAAGLLEYSVVQGERPAVLHFDIGYRPGEFGAKG